MKLKLDENLPAELMTDVRSLGHEIDSVSDEGLEGAPDNVVLAKARDEGRVLLTLDKGIGDIRAYKPTDYAGIVLFRTPGSGRGATLAFVRQHLARVLGFDLHGHLLVITERSIRTR